MVKNNKTRVFLVACAVAALAVLAACGGGNTDESDPVAQTEREAAQGLFDTLPVSWAPTKLVFNLNPGSRQSIPVTLTTTKALTNARIVFVPDLRNAVTVSPETIPSLAAGQSATVTLTFAPLATDTRKLIAGVVLLYDRNATVSRPLPVKVSLVKTETINGVAVPPEPPPELNNATLAGFDVNANGVRDDVERALVSRHGTNRVVREAALKSAHGHQLVVTASQTNSDAARSAIRESGAAGVCAARVFRAAGLNATEELNESFVRTFNTPERLTADSSVSAVAGVFRQSVTSISCD